MSTGREGAPRGIIHRGKRPHWLMTSRMKGWWLLPSHGKPLVSCGTTQGGGEGRGSRGGRWAGLEAFPNARQLVRLSVSRSVRKASSQLSGNSLSHPLPSKNESKSVVPFFFFSPFQSQPWLAWFYFFFPLHLNLAPQLKNKGKVSGDWRISHRALHIRHPCFGQGSWFLRLPFWT